MSFIRLITLTLLLVLFFHKPLYACGSNYLESTDLLTTLRGSTTYSQEGHIVAYLNESSNPNFVLQLYAGAGTIHIVDPFFNWNKSVKEFLDQLKANIESIPGANVKANYEPLSRFDLNKTPQELGLYPAPDPWVNSIEPIELTITQENLALGAQTVKIYLYLDSRHLEYLPLGRLEGFFFDQHKQGPAAYEIDQTMTFGTNKTRFLLKTFSTPDTPQHELLKHFQDNWFIHFTTRPLYHSIQTDPKKVFYMQGHNLTQEIWLETTLEPKQAVLERLKTSDQYELYRQEIHAIARKYRLSHFGSINPGTEFRFLNRDLEANEHALYIASGADVFKLLSMFPKAEHLHFFDILAGWGSCPAEIIFEIQNRFRKLKNSKITIVDDGFSKIYAKELLDLKAFKELIHQETTPQNLLKPIIFDVEFDTEALGRLNKRIYIHYGDLGSTDDLKAVLDSIPKGKLASILQSCISGCPKALDLQMLLNWSAPDTQFLFDDANDEFVSRDKEQQDIETFIGDLPLRGTIKTMSFNKGSANPFEFWISIEKK